ncbi:UNVERIFIED_CONTAM: putative mitochondrial protein [Sesamum calycinum]|uniref:Mitochondrial protein n=1 Tax=Sesamum calycinum TaxID=2727403 RepID=A0AAW2N4K7_9LAMI
MELQQHLAEILGILLENKHEIYLCLPAMAFRSKKALFAALTDHIWRRIQGWHEKTLSQASKAVLIQAVVQAIPSYAMSCYRLPGSLLKELHSLAADFFWHDGDRRKIHWLAWDKMCMSKSIGGLGFRNLEAFNLALLGKQLWRILSKPHSLVGRVLKVKYFPRTHLFDAQLGSRPSYTWRSMYAALDLVQSGCRWRIGTDSELILQIPLSLTGELDLIVWRYTRNGMFSVRSAYHLALALSSSAGPSSKRWPKHVWRAIWQSHILNKAKLVHVAWDSRLDRGGSTEVVEAYAAREAVRLACQQRWSKVVIEGDCLSLLNKISNTCLDSMVSPLVLDIRSLAAQVESVTFSFVRRLGNSVADFLACISPPRLLKSKASQGAWENTLSYTDKGQILSWNPPSSLHTPSALDKAYDDYTSRHSHRSLYPRYSLRMHVTVMISQVKRLILALSELEIPVIPVKP